jgi:hypothetical protein
VADTGKPADKVRSICASQPAVCVGRQSVRDRSDGSSSQVPATALAALPNLASKDALEHVLDAHLQVRPGVVINIRLR